MHKNAILTSKILRLCGAKSSERCLSDDWRSVAGPRSEKSLPSSPLHLCSEVFICGFFSQIHFSDRFLAVINSVFFLTGVHLICLFVRLDLGEGKGAEVSKPLTFVFLKLAKISFS